MTFKVGDKVRLVNNNRTLFGRSVTIIAKQGAMAVVTNVVTVEGNDYILLEWDRSDANLIGTQRNGYYDPERFELITEN